MITITESQSEIFIIAAAVVSILFGLINALAILRIKMVSIDEEQMALKDDKHLKQLKEM